MASTSFQQPLSPPDTQPAAGPSTAAATLPPGVLTTTPPARLEALLAERDSLLRQLGGSDERCTVLTQQLAALSGKSRSEIDELMSKVVSAVGASESESRGAKASASRRLTAQVAELTEALEKSNAVKQQLAKQGVPPASESAAAGDDVAPGAAPGLLEELRAVRADEVACLTEQVDVAQESCAAQAKQAAVLRQANRGQSEQIGKMASLLWGGAAGSTATGPTLDALLADAMSTAACAQIKAVGVVAAYRGLSAADPGTAHPPTDVTVAAGVVDAGSDTDADPAAQPGRGTMDEIRQTLAMLKVRRQPAAATNATNATNANAEDDAATATFTVCSECTDIAQQLEAVNGELGRLLRTCELQKIQIDCQTRFIDAESREQWREINSLQKVRPFYSEPPISG